MEVLGMIIPLAGFWDTILAPLHWAVSGLLVLSHMLFAPLFGNDSGVTWTLSIVLLTVIIRTLLIPLFVKQIRSSRNMQIVQPKLREIQKKYGHDQERLGQETMKLYKDEGINPMASCFPILLQMPIFFALFNVLNGAARGKVVYGSVMTQEQITGLSNAKFFGARLADTFMPITHGFGVVQVVGLILIVAMVATQFYSQRQLMAKNMPPEAMTGPIAQQQKMMLYLFPIIFGVGGITFPIGVLIYWTTTNLWSMGQQFYVIRESPTPGTEAYEKWEQRMRAKGHDPKLYKPGEKIPRNPVRQSPEPVAEEVVDVDSPDRPRVQRQQPRRQTRSNRKGR